MELKKSIHDLLRQIGPGWMMTTAYDTAWLARLSELGEPLGSAALDWLREHQLEDGSWGAEQPVYYHDRVSCTLAAMNALARRGRMRDRPLLRKAEVALEKFTKGLHTDPAGETVGFELIVPTLLLEAKMLGAIYRQEDEVLCQLTPKRSAKLAALPDGMINRFVTVAHSSEMVGLDGKQLLDLKNLQEVNGSVGYSPSATAYFARYVRPNDPKALAYLRSISGDGGVPNVAPFEIFERAWALWNIVLTGPLDDKTLALCQPHIEFLKEDWQPGKGVGFAAGYTPKDGDDTSLVFDVLARFGHELDLEAIQHYEHVYYYRCFDLESNPSISANIHVLGALRQAQLEVTHPAVQKVVEFLRAVRVNDSFWFDKWHASPYYATTQGIIAGVGYIENLVDDAVEWLIQTQNEDGAWGYYMSTAEETAYCLQALVLAKREGYSIPDEVLDKGKLWLEDHMEPPYPPLWIGKCLYCPELVVRSAVLSALMLVS